MCLVVVGAWRVAPAEERPVGAIGGSPWAGSDKVVTGRITVVRTEGDWRIERVLHSSLDFDVPGTLGEWAERLSAELGVSVTIDESLEAGVTEQTAPVTTGRGQRLGAVLRHALRPLGATYWVENETLVIGTQEEAETHLTERVYYVGGLLRRLGVRTHHTVSRYPNRFGLRRPATNVFVEDWQELVALLKETVEPDTWSGQGGAGEMAEFPQRGALVIIQTFAVHEQIAQLLQTLLHVPLQVHTFEGVSASRGIRPFASAEETRIYSLLDEPAAFSVPQDSTLDNLAEILSRQHGIAVMLDDRVESRTTRLPGGPARSRKLSSALRAWLRQADCAYWIVDDALVIGSYEEAEQHLEMRVYPVYDLVTVPGIAGVQNNYDFDSLIELIKEMIEPDSWGDQGGPGMIREFPQRACLVFCQTEDIHEQVAHLLAALRQLPAQP